MKKTSKVQAVYLLAAFGSGLGLMTMAMAQTEPFGVPVPETQFVPPTPEPEQRSIVFALQASENFDHLSKALQVAGLQEMLSSSGEYTLFAPINSAFERLVQEDYDTLMNDPQMLRMLLMNHLVEKNIPFSELELLPGVRTLAGQPLPLEGEGREIFIGDALVVLRDIDAGNGVIHVVDAFLFPRGEEKFMEMRERMEATGIEGVRTSAFPREEQGEDERTSTRATGERESSSINTSTLLMDETSQESTATFWTGPSAQWETSATTRKGGGREAINDPAAGRAQMHESLPEPRSPMATINELEIGVGSTDQRASAGMGGLTSIETPETGPIAYEVPGAAANFPHALDADVAPGPSSLDPENLPTSGIDYVPGPFYIYGRTYVSPYGYGYGYDYIPGYAPGLGTGYVVPDPVPVYITPGAAIGTDGTVPTSRRAPTGGAAGTETVPDSQSATDDFPYPGGAATAGAGRMDGIEMAQATTGEETLEERLEGTRSGPPPGNSTGSRSAAVGDIPGAVGDIPGAVDGTPGAVDGTPGAVGDIPGAVDGTPGAVGDIPGAVDGTPGAVGDIPGAVDGTPGAVGDFPGAVGDIPGAVGDIPGAVDGTPGAVGDIPGAVDGTPGAGGTRGTMEGTSGASGNISGTTGALPGVVDGTVGAVDGAFVGRDEAFDPFEQGPEVEYGRVGTGVPQTFRENLDMDSPAATDGTNAGGATGTTGMTPEQGTGAGFGAAGTMGRGGTAETGTIGSWSGAKAPSTIGERGTVPGVGTQIGGMGEDPPVIDRPEIPASQATTPGDAYQLPRVAAPVTGLNAGYGITQTDTDGRASAQSRGLEGNEAATGVGIPGTKEEADTSGMSRSAAVAGEGLWDRPLEERTIAQVALSSEFEQFASLVRQAGLQNMLEDLEGKTLLIPSQTAFEMTPQSIIEEVRIDREALRRIIHYHIIDREVTRSDMRELGELRTEEGSLIPVSVLDIGIRLGPARIEHSNLKLRNGMIHVIDRLLVPPAQ